MKFKSLIALGAALASLGIASAWATGEAPGTSVSQSSSTGPSSDTQTDPSLAGAGQTGSSPAQTSSSGVNNQAQSSGYDERFLIEFIQAGRGEIQAAQAILAKTTSEELKTLANQLVTDHTLSIQQAQALASEKQITVPEGILPRDERLIARINAASSPADADKHYINRLIDEHQEELAQAAVYDSDAADPQIRNFVESDLPTVVKHLIAAVAARAAIEDDSTSLSESSSSSSSSSTLGGPCPSSQTTSSSIDVSSGTSSSGASESSSSSGPIVTSPSDSSSSSSSSSGTGLQ